MSLGLCTKESFFHEEKDKGDDNNFYNYSNFKQLSIWKFLKYVNEDKETGLMDLGVSQFQSWN